MDSKLCRICGKQDDNYVQIFKTEGLRNKIETCLPIVITQQYPLPDIICNLCLDSVDNFYSFIKNCLQNIIVLEAQYDIIESCLKTKRKVDKSVLISDSDFCEPIDITLDKSDYVSLQPTPSVPTELLTSAKDSPIPNFTCGLVDYDSSDEYDSDPHTDIPKTDDATTEIGVTTGNIINEIVQRKYLKRKIDDLSGASCSKSPRLEDSSSRRKNKQPKRIEYHLETKIESPPLPQKIETHIAPIIPYSDDSIPEKLLNLPPDLSIIKEEIPQPEPMQTCLLCEQQFYGAIPLTAHMYETHGIDLAQVFAATQTVVNPGIHVPQTNQQQSVNVPPPVTPPAPPDKPQKKKLPNLVKISDVLNVRKQLPQDNYDEPPHLEPQEKIPPPLPVINKSPYTCPDCNNSHLYKTFKEYSNHRRSQHQIFHCDLCPKFYGRNSHLWKHVNRVHKGHPSITCQQCYKTSASKYHLAQHFNKMHSIKSQQKSKVLAGKGNGSGYGTPEENDEEFMNQKFQGFDFKSVRQSFLRQEQLEKQKYVSILKKNDDDGKDEDVKPNINDIVIKKEPGLEVETKREEIKSAPKEIDSSSNLYTNIITNYTPPVNEGAFKCPKCFKGFHKKNLLKKHKKNCRPRLQKDLLTRCKTCSRIFKDRQSLAKHLINYHSEYTCEICNLAVQSKCEIVSHIRFSHPNSELTCHCGQILRSNSDLQKHKLDHRDSHVCQFCGDMLPTKIKLKMHILSLHRKILSLSCGICLKLFETQHILRDHVRLIHGDQLSPLTSCTVCGKNYGSKWKTYDHLNKSHGRIFKACKACLEVFETEAELQRHFEVDHLNAKTNEKKNTVVEKMTIKEEFPNESNEHIQEYVQRDDNTSSESEDGETSGESSGIQPRPLQDDAEYRNYIYREFQQTIDKKSNGVTPKNNELQKYPINKLSLLEKRLLGKKISDDGKSKGEKIVENGGKRKIVKPDRYEDDILQNSSKRTVYVNSNDPSLCEICLKVWPAKKHLWQHYIRCHKQVAATVCGICLKTNPSYSSLQTHLRETHPNLLYGCGFGSNFICKICGRYHNASSKLRLHMAIHVGFNESMLDEFSMNSVGKVEIEEESSVDEANESELCEIKKEIKEEKMDEEKEEGEEIEDDVDDMNYESLIEEIEVCSDSEYENDNDNDPQNVEYTDYVHEEQGYSMELKPEQELTTSESEEESEPDESSNDATENELEQEMLKNMIGENVTIANEIKTESSNESESQNYEAMDFDDDDDDDEDDDTIKLPDNWTSNAHFIQQLKNIKQNITDDGNVILYQHKEIELDNAIKSIAMDDEDYANLNESELDAAVGSIL